MISSRLEITPQTYICGLDILWSLWRFKEDNLLEVQLQDMTVTPGSSPLLSMYNCLHHGWNCLDLDSSNMFVHVNLLSVAGLSLWSSGARHSIYMRFQE